MNDNDIIEIIDDIDDNSSQKSSGDVLDIEKKFSEVKYEPIDSEKETIEVVEDIEPSKNKSGLVLVVILFVLLILFIIFLPQINKVLGSLF